MGNILRAIVTLNMEICLEKEKKKNKDNHHIFMGYTETLFDEKRTI